GVAQRLGELLRVGDLAVLGVEDGNVRHAELLRKALLRLLQVNRGLFRRGRDDDEVSVLAAGQLHEALNDLRAELAAADDDQSPLLWAAGGGVGGDGEQEGCGAQART